MSTFSRPLSIGTPSNETSLAGAAAASQADQHWQSHRVGLGNVGLGNVGLGNVGLGKSVVDLSVVIPMFNEATRIEQTLVQIHGSNLNRAGVEFVFVDDGSSDSTVEVLTRSIDLLGFASSLLIVSLGRNRGKGAAVKAGLIASSGAHAVFLDADLSLDPSIVDVMLDRLVETGADVMVGYRVIDSAVQPKLRRVMSVSFTAIVKRLAPTGVQDTQCACKVFTRAAIQTVVEPLQTEGFAFDVELLLRASAAGLVVVEHAVPWKHQDGSQVNPVTAPLSMIREVLRARRFVNVERG
jgi:Glycosyl transferase family 2